MESAAHDCEGFAPPTSELSLGGGNQEIALWGTFARTPLGHPIDGPDGITTYYFFSSSVDRNDTAVLNRLDISPEHWIELATNFESHFKGLVGSAHAVERMISQFGLNRKPNYSNSLLLFG